MYNDLLDEGMEIHEYMASYLHAKVAVIDDHAMVGSSNLDPFSLLLAREANVFVDDPEFARQLKHALENEMQNDARTVTAEHLQKRTLYERVLDAFAYGLLRLGVALTVKRRNIDDGTRGLRRQKCRPKNGRGSGARRHKSL